MINKLIRSATAVASGCALIAVVGCSKEEAQYQPVNITTEVVIRQPITNPCWLEAGDNRIININQIQSIDIQRRYITFDMQDDQYAMMLQDSSAANKMFNQIKQIINQCNNK